MAEGKKSFIIYSEWKELFESLDDTQCAVLIRHIFRYVNDENPEIKDPVLKVVWTILQPVLKRDLKKWEEQKEQRSQAGKKSAEKRQRASTVVDNPQQTSTVNVDVNGNANVNGSVVDKAQQPKISVIPLPTTEDLYNSLDYTGKQLYEMFRRVTDRTIYDDHRIILEVNKFRNRYPDVLVKKSGPLINTWTSNMKPETEQHQQAQTTPSSNFIDLIKNAGK